MLNSTWRKYTQRLNRDLNQITSFNWWQSVTSPCGPKSSILCWPTRVFITSRLGICWITYIFKKTPYRVMFIPMVVVDTVEKKDKDELDHIDSPSRMVIDLYSHFCRLPCTYPVQFPLTVPSVVISNASWPSAQWQVSLYFGRALLDLPFFEQKGAGNNCSVFSSTLNAGAPNQFGIAPGTWGLIHLPTMISNLLSLHSLPILYI